jgi:hypothetical protein
MIFIGLLATLSLVTAEATLPDEQNDIEEYDYTVCNVAQEADGCCDPIFESKSEWKTKAEGGGKWTTSLSSIRFDIADDKVCNGNATAVQRGKATLNSNFADDMVVKFSMAGEAEASYETLEFFIDGKLEITVQAQEDDTCKSGRCQMCSVNMEPEIYDIKAGEHNFEVKIDTQDGRFHKGAYFEIYFSAERKDTCGDCVCSEKAPEEISRMDIFDFYDENMDTILTQSDLESMSKHMHIWDEIVEKANTGSLDESDIDSHIQTYKDIWKAIVAVIKELDVKEDGKVDKADIDLIHEELDDALKNLKKWEKTYKQVVPALDGKFGEYDNETSTGNLSISFDELENHKQDAINEYSSRLRAAFARISGSEDQQITKTELDQNKESIALLLAAFEDLSTQDHISKDTYEEKVEYIQGLIDKEVNNQAVALAQIKDASGRRLFTDLKSETWHEYDYDL